MNEGFPHLRAVLETVSNRLDAVSHVLESTRITEDVREKLRQVPDLDRALSRLSLDRGGPRDLTAIRNGLAEAGLIASHGLGDAPKLLSSALQNLTGHNDLIDLLDQALIAEPPLLARDGGFIAPEYDEDLDEARKLRDEGRSVIAQMQKEFATQTGISALKIKHNNVLGYFIETTATHADKMLSPPLNETFIHRQTTANQVRFTTVELSEMETKILNAGNRALEIEKRLYEALKSAILDSAALITQTARGLGRDRFGNQFGPPRPCPRLVQADSRQLACVQHRWRAPSRCGKGFA